MDCRCVSTAGCAPVIVVSPALSPLLLVTSGLSGRRELSDLKEYLLGEFVEQYQEGRLSRRKALRLIAGITGSLATANAILAACTPAPAPTATTTQPPTAAPAVPTPAPTKPAVATPVPTKPAAIPSPAAKPAAASPLSVSPTDPAIEAMDVQFQGQGATLMGYLAKPRGNGPFPAVLVCHENRGLVDHIKDVTRRLAKADYAALAVDLLSRQGGTGRANPDQVPGILANMPPDQIVQDFQAGLAYLKGQSYVRGDRAGMIGFCFGGGVTWRVATKTPELRAAVPYYGPNPPLEDVPGIQAAVLAHYGEQDQRINQGIPAIEEAMQRNGKTFEKVIYPGAGHAFNNDTGQNYNQAAAIDAWNRTLAWLDRYLKA